MWYNSILATYDGSPSSKHSVSVATQLAKENPSSRLILLHVVALGTAAMGGASLTTEVVEAAEEARRYLDSVAAKVEAETKVVIFKGATAADSIVRIAGKYHCDLIVMGCHGSGGYKGYLGSVSHAVVEAAGANVLITKFRSKN
ncbi:universal stress family protein [Winkia neuii]|uniref:universal stress protein n=1 Tax=Winkia neuii TaxID=33007 RepID=UPI000763E055|nr:universal stress protein [Winkia neuii]KWZ73250.1 universal stress family protein [Winkia neuii]